MLNIDNREDNLRGRVLFYTESDEPGSYKCMIVARVNPHNINYLKWGFGIKPEKAKESKTFTFTPVFERGAEVLNSFEGDKMYVESDKTKFEQKVTHLGSVYVVEYSRQQRLLDLERRASQNSPTPERISALENIIERIPNTNNSNLGDVLSIVDSAYGDEPYYSDIHRVITHVLKGESVTSELVEAYIAKISAMMQEEYEAAQIHATVLNELES